MNIEKIKELVRVVEKSGINEITIEENGTKITIRKGVFTAENQEKSTVKKNAEAVLSEESEKKYPDNWKEIKAPMVGTFFRASTPDADPFVKEGDEVSEEQTVCILEAMRLMNEITTEEAGVIKKIMVENNASVEYGQPLFLYEPK